MTRSAEIALDVDDLDRLRRAVDQARAVGGDLSWLGEMLAQRVASLPAARISRRDAALAALAEHFIGSDRGKARQTAAALRQYEATRWRHEQSLDVAPASHGDIGRALYCVMKASSRGIAPGFETVRKVLSSSGAPWVRKQRLVLTHGAPDDSAGSNKRGRKLKLAAQPDQIEALAALARQPSTQKIVETDRARIVAERQARVDRIKALDAAETVAWPKRQRAILEAAAKVRDAERQLREANDKLSAANADNASTNHSYTMARQAEETALIAGANMAVIQAWKRELLDEIDAARRPGVLAHVETTARNPVTRESTRRVSSNYASVVARLTAIRAAYEAVGLLALEPDQVRLPEIIAGLRDRLPKIDAGPTFPVASEGEAV